jgi:flagellar hook-length control protein FliK
MDRNRRASPVAAAARRDLPGRGTSCRAAGRSCPAGYGTALARRLRGDRRRIVAPGDPPPMDGIASLPLTSFAAPPSPAAAAVPADVSFGALLTRAALAAAPEDGSANGVPPPAATLPAPAVLPPPALAAAPAGQAAPEAATAPAGPAPTAIATPPGATLPASPPAPAAPAPAPAKAEAPEPRIPAVPAATEAAPPSAVRMPAPAGGEGPETGTAAATARSQRPADAEEVATEIGAASPLPVPALPPPVAIMVVPGGAAAPAAAPPQADTAVQPRPAGAAVPVAAATEAPAAAVPTLPAPDHGAAAPPMPDASMHPPVMTTPADRAEPALAADPPSRATAAPRAAPEAPTPVEPGTPNAAPAAAPAPTGSPAMPAPAPPPAAPARQIAPVLVAVAIAGGTARLSITLEPAELGRVEISVERRGEATDIRVIAERPETLALIQRDQRELDRTLTQAGIGSEGRSLSFTLSDGGAGGFAQDRGGEAERMARAMRGTAAATPAEAGAPPPRRLLSLLDLDV